MSEEENKILDQIRKTFKNKDNGYKPYPDDVCERIMELCIAGDLKPSTSMIEILSFNNRKTGGKNYVPMRTIAAARSIAQRAGWAGNDGIVWSEEAVNMVVDGAERIVPKWGQMTIYKMVQGQRCAFVSPKLYAKETVQTTQMWGNKLLFMFEKNIEAAGLRRAFPEVLEDAYIPEEGYIPGQEEATKVNTSGLDALKEVKAVKEEAPVAETTIIEVEAPQVVPVVEIVATPVEPLVTVADENGEVKLTLDAERLTEWLNRIRECENQQYLADVVKTMKDMYVLSATDKKHLNKVALEVTKKIKENNGN